MACDGGEPFRFRLVSFSNHHGDSGTWSQRQASLGRNFKGKHEIANFFAQVGEHFEFSEFAPREMIEQGDTVVVLGTLEGRAKKTGKTVKNEWAHVFKYSNGKVVFFQEYIDTAAGVLAMS
jgi:uncharacterized protein